MSYSYGMVAPSAKTMTAPSRINAVLAQKLVLERQQRAAGVNPTGTTPAPDPGFDPAAACKATPGGVWDANAGTCSVQYQAAAPPDPSTPAEDTMKYAMYGLVAIAGVGLTWYFVSKRKLPAAGQDGPGGIIMSYAYGMETAAFPGKSGSGQTVSSAIGFRFRAPTAGTPQAAFPPPGQSSMSTNQGGPQSAGFKPSSDSTLFRPATTNVVSRPVDPSATPAFVPPATPQIPDPNATPSGGDPASSGSPSLLMFGLVTVALVGIAWYFVAEKKSA